MGGGLQVESVRADPDSAIYREQQLLARLRAIEGPEHDAQMRMLVDDEDEDPPVKTIDERKALKKANASEDEAWLAEYLSQQTDLPNFAYNPLPQCRNRTARELVNTMRELRDRLARRIKRREEQRVQAGGGRICANAKDIENLDYELADLKRALSIVSPRVSIAKGYKEHDGKANDPKPQEAFAGIFSGDLPAGPSALSIGAMLKMEARMEEGTYVPGEELEEGYGDEGENDTEYDPFAGWEKEYGESASSKLGDTVPLDDGTDAGPDDDMDAGQGAFEIPAHYSNELPPIAKKAPSPKLPEWKAESSGYGQRRRTSGGGRTFTAIHAVLAAVVVAASFL